MNSIGNVGALLPLWIVGAPFLAGLIAMFSTPRPARIHEREELATPRAVPRF